MTEPAMVLDREGTVTSPAGFAAGATACGLKQSGRLDLALVASDSPAAAAGLFTTNRVVAAPVMVSRETLAGNASSVNAVVINAGNANACTGERGQSDARAMQRLAAGVLGVAPEAVLVMSTGVIGVPLAMERVAAGISAAAEALSPDRGARAARAIMTTDTHPKHLAVHVTIGGKTVTIGGMAKGAGMIHPNLATMLALLTTDAALAPHTLQRLLEQSTAVSFNRISVDGDTSTNDTVLLLANGASGVAPEGDDLDLFAGALTLACTELAKQIVRDGEGATKFVTIAVIGASDDEAAHRIANTVATSPLVKTAFAGSDPNWGRILAAAGRAGVPFHQEEAALWASAGERSLQLLAGGTPLPYAESDAATIFAQHEFTLRLQVGAGTGEAIVWTCDLSHDYVTINADYRT